MLLYMIRHLNFTYHAVFGKSHQISFQRIEGIYLPKVTVLIPAHNEKSVIGPLLERMSAVTYPKEKLEIVVVNDSSTDGTGEIADEFSKNYDFITVLHRRNKGAHGKPEAMNEGLKASVGEIIVTFDADYYPQLDIIEKLVAPFVDPEVGMVQGRVTVLNEEDSFVSKLVTLERIGGYRVDQLARDDLVLSPQYGGTVGALRRSFLERIGGWDSSMLTEDTDLTVRCIVDGQKVRYVNDAESYEESVTTWKAYWNQRYRWAKGHMQCFRKYFVPVVKSKNLSFSGKIELILLLSIYFLPVLALIGWITGLLAYITGEAFMPYATQFFYIVPVFTYSAVGNFAPFFEVGMAAYLDERKNLQLMIPALVINFVVMVFCCTKALLDLIIKRSGKQKWNHTNHNGKSHNGNGNGRNGNGHNGNGNGFIGNGGSKGSLFLATNDLFIRSRPAIPKMGEQTFE